MLSFLYVLFHSQIALSSSRHARQTLDVDVLDWVDPLIGTQGGGNVFAGATLPYGMAKGPPGVIRCVAVTC